MGLPLQAPVPAALSIAELSTAMPRAGGIYYFLDRSLGPMVGTIGGLGTWRVLVLKSAFAELQLGLGNQRPGGNPCRVRRTTWSI